jgi:hypothetical protein
MSEIVIETPNKPNQSNLDLTISVTRNPLYVTIDCVEEGQNNKYWVYQFIILLTKLVVYDSPIHIHI